jgi:endonuclease YncB( thermonuclease family)
MRTQRLPRNLLWTAPIVLTLVVGPARGKEPPERMPVIHTSVGDTLVVQNSTGERPWFRLIGVGTPESSDSGMPEQFKGMPVPEVLKAWARGISVSIVADPQVPDSLGERDRAYAHRSPDGLDLGLALIQYGWAYARRDYPYTRQAAYLAAEQKARSAGRGYWASKGPVQSSTVPDPSLASPAEQSGSSLSASKSPAGAQFSSPTIASSSGGPGKLTAPPRRRIKRYAPQPDAPPNGGFLGIPMFGGPSFGGPSFGGPGSVYVNGYYRSNGTYVQPYTRRPPGG